MATGECWECGSVGHVHNHHVVPRSRGGTRTVPLCEACHGHAHHRDGAMKTSRMCRTALAAKRARGERTGKVPYGYRLAADGVHLVQHDNEQHVVAVARELRAAGLSLRAISAELATRGLLNRNGRAFGAQSVANMLEAAA